MNSHPPRPDLNSYTSVRQVLLGGVVLSILLLILGFLLSITGGGLSNATIPLSELAPRLVQAEPLAIATLGLIVLMLTPTIAVVAIGTAFFKSRNRFYSLVSLAVLGVLLLSIALATL